MQPLFATRPIPFDEAWPESWRVSHKHDAIEIWGSGANPGYTRSYHARMRRVFDALRRYTPAGGKVLDLAAAQGNYSLSASAMGYDVTWNDLRGELADYVRLKSPEQAARLEFVPGNVLELGDRFKGAYDTVLALEVIEHVAHPDQFMAALAGLLRPGGHLILTTPNGGYFRNPLPRFSDHPDPSIFESEQFQPNGDGHIFLLHEDEMRSLSAKAGLKLVEHALFTNPLTAGFLGTRPLQRVLPAPAFKGVEWLTQHLPRPVARKLHVASLSVLKPASA